MELVHGGDWAGYRAEFGRDALDFSANVSPLGLPAGVAAAITAALPMADRYPDPLCRALRTKLAAAESVDTAQILCGNGAADLIYRLALALRPRRALLPAPTVAEVDVQLGKCHDRLVVIRIYPDSTFQCKPGHSKFAHLNEREDF